jgi:hypothetical protein
MPTVPQNVENGEGSEGIVEMPDEREAVVEIVYLDE